MSAVQQHRGFCAPVLVDNVDTDQIIPSREMKRISKHGLGDGLFAGWRYLYKGQEKVGLNREFVLNQPDYAGATILLGGRNFGCGSSREHAVWALRDFGIKVIIAESFGKIFRSNCARNGLLAIEVNPEHIEKLAGQSGNSNGPAAVVVDLVECEIRLADGDTIGFEIEESDRSMLLQGLDYIDYSLRYESDIDRFVEQDRQSRPWAYLCPEKGSE